MQFVKDVFNNICVFRWKIFSYIISPKLNTNVLQNLADPSFIYPVCQLFLMQQAWKTPLLYKWEVELFLLQHLRFKNLSDNDLQEISRPKIVPAARGVHLAAIYTQGKVDLASKLSGGIVQMKYLMPLYSSFDGIHFQKLYLACKEDCSVESEASLDELILIRHYFDIITSDGTKILQ